MKDLNRKTLAILLVLVPACEGLRQYAFYDPVGIPTICFGRTAGVKMGQTATEAECKGMLIEDLNKANSAVESLVRVPLPDSRRAALVSFVYNVGQGSFARSTLLRKLNAGDVIGACNELPRWIYAKGIPLPGLVKRRELERKLCLEGA